MIPFYRKQEFTTKRWGRVQERSVGGDSDLSEAWVEKREGSQALAKNPGVIELPSVSHRR